MENFFKILVEVYMRGRAPSREPARPLKLPQPGPLLNIVGRTSDWFVLEGSEADPHSAPMAQLSTRQPAGLTYAPLYLSVPWKGVQGGNQDCATRMVSPLLCLKITLLLVQFFL